MLTMPLVSPKVCPGDHVHSSEYRIDITVKVHLANIVAGVAFLPFVHIFDYVKEGDRAMQAGSESWRSGENSRAIFNSDLKTKRRNGHSDYDETSVELNIRRRSIRFDGNLDVPITHAINLSLNN
jgi:hypothetical protein